MIVDSGKYYLYRHIRLDKNEPFYIGVGGKEYNGKYVNYARAFSKTGRTKYWKNISILDSGYEIEILLESDNYDFILEKEIEFIKLYGRKDLGLGPLVNMTDGGKGSPRAKRPKCSEETKIRISKLHKGKILSEETKKKLSISAIDRMKDSSRRKKLSKVISGTKRTEKVLNIKPGKFRRVTQKPIYQYDLDKNFIREWECLSVAAFETNVCKPNICKSLKGIRDSAGGYIWKYADC